MNISIKKIIFIVITVCMVLSVVRGASPDSEEGLLQIHLPREVTIKDAFPKLGEVAVIRGDEQLVGKARTVALGQICMAGQRLVLDRAVILSRLASSGIPAEKVKLTGAESVTVRKEQQTVTGQELVDAAMSFLKVNPPVSSMCGSEVIRMPRDIVLPEPTKDVSLTASFVKSDVKNQIKVRVVATAQGKEIAGCEVAFRPKYQCRRVVSLTDIPAGVVLGPESVKIETVVAEQPEPANWKPPYGFIARRRVPANAVISSEMVEPVKPDIVVKRNQAVVMRIERPGLVVTAAGTVLKDARTGEYVKVQNVDSRQIVLCKVKDDGTVEPVI